MGMVRVQLRGGAAYFRAEDGALEVEFVDTDGEPCALAREPDKILYWLNILGGD